MCFKAMFVILHLAYELKRGSRGDFVASRRRRIHQMADFNSMTVLELRKYAREHGVTIGAGKSKADIVALLMDAEGVQSAEPANDSPAEAAPAQEPVKRAGASFMAAWHNPAGRYAAPQRGAGGNRPQRPTFSTGLTSWECRPLP